MAKQENSDILSILKTISDKADQTRDAVTAIDKKLDLHIQKTEYELANINRLDELQNQLLDEHIEGVNTLKTWCDSHERANEKRFQKIEEPKRWLSMTKGLLVWLASVATAVTVIIKVINKLGL